MPVLPPALLRAPGVLVATAPRRAAAWTAVAGAGLAVAAARAVYALVGLPPSPLTAVGLDVAAVAAVVGAYALVAARAAARAGARQASPVRTLYGLAAASAALVAVEWWVGTAVGGSLGAGGMPAGPGALAAGAAFGVAEAALAIALGLGLRPLVLYRRGRWTVGLWRVAVAAAVAAALAGAGQPADVPPDAPGVVFDAVPLVIGIGLVLRQRWVTALVGRQRLAAAVLALALCAALVGLLVVRAGPGGLAVEAGGPDVRAPASMVLSHSLSSLATLAMGLGALYALTAGLVLVFQLPAAEPTRAGERRAFRSLAGVSGRLLDRDALAAAIARGPAEAGLAEAAWVVVQDPRHGDLTFHVAAADGLDAGAATAAVDADALVRAAAALGGPLVLGRAEADHRVRARPGSGLGSLVVLPLDAAPDGDAAPDDAALAPPRAALIAARRTPDAFEADDIAALGAFAAQAALALANADLVAQAFDRGRLARELALARDVQRRLFPQSLPALPGLDIAAAEHAALEVGGDYYDAVTLSPSCAGVIVADVSGKGAAAAFHMAEMKGIFQVGARLTRAPAEFLCSAAEALAPSLRRGTFVSAAYAVVDADAATLAVARAGHCPPVLARDAALAAPGQSAVRLLRSRGVALGLGSPALFRRTLGEESVALAPGDAIVLYTDGLVEARDADGAEWGYARLLDTVAMHRAEPAAGLLAALLAAHRAWSATPDAPADDVTVVVIKWNGTPPRNAVQEPLDPTQPSTDAIS